MRKILVTLIVLLFSHPLIAKDKEAPLSEMQALDMVIQKIKDDALYSAWTKMECLSFLTEEVSDSSIDIAIRENHKVNCPGDPVTAPIVDRFRVLRLTKKLLWYNVIDDAYIDYNAKDIRR